MTNLSPDQEITLWIGALDYYLGRQTYSVHTFNEMLREHYSTLGPKTRNLVKSRLHEAFDRLARLRQIGVANATEAVFGSAIDRQAWEATQTFISEPDNDL